MTTNFSADEATSSTVSLIESGALAPVCASPPFAQRLLAAGAHLLMLASLPGIVLTCAIWLTCRRAPFVAQHARRALVAEVLAHLVLGVVVTGLFGSALTFMGTVLSNHAGAGQFSLYAVLGALGGLTLLPLVALLGFVLLALSGAVRALRGQIPRRRQRA